MKIINKKPYTWEEIKQFLIKELKKTKNILTFGTIGSCNVEHDIDVIITKKPGSPSSGFFREVHNLFDAIDRDLNEKYKARLIRLPGLSFQGEFLNLIKMGENDLIFHTLVYVSSPQVENEWKPWSSKDERVLDILKNNYNCLFGKKEDLFKGDFSKGNYYDFMFTFLSHYDRINFQYPEKNLVAVMNKFYDFLFGKRLGIKTPEANDKEQVREVFYKLCDILDELEKKKQESKTK